jgi:hypothetical protein
MADSDKTEHISESMMERFYMRALTENELAMVTRHLTGCPDCQADFVSILRRQKGATNVSFTLAPELWLRHEHVDYEQLVGLADNSLDATELEIIDLHFNTCATCREDARSFLAFRDQIEPELQVRYGPVSQEPQSLEAPLWTWWRRLAWKPAYAAAFVLIGIGLVIAVLVLKRRAANLEARQTSPSQINAGAVGQMPPTSSPTLTVRDREPIQQTQTARAPLVLNDARGTITVDKSGVVSGLDDIPAERRREIAEALIAEKIETPEVVKELSGPGGTLRGASGAQLFKLVSPARTVIVSDRPSFQWEKLPSATSYRVYVGDSKGHEVAKSEELLPSRTAWMLPVSLKRGEVYSWAVAAVVDGKEVFAPGAAAPEMKFQVLRADSLRQLKQLEKTDSHLALGVFYAKVGMTAEAELEFRELVRLNPKLKAASNLLRSVKLSH